LQGGEVVKGQVYCTDPVSSIVVLQDPTVNDIRMVSVSSIQQSKLIQEATKSQFDPTPTEIPHTKKILEEREKRAIKLAQESLRHLNPKVSEWIGRPDRKGPPTPHWSNDYNRLANIIFLIELVLPGHQGFSKGTNDI
jgi:hypothetical protein